MSPVPECTITVRVLANVIMEISEERPSNSYREDYREQKPSEDLDTLLCDYVR
jgi:hypothetical protein